MLLAQLILSCSPLVNVETMSSLVETETNSNPYAIAIVKNGFRFRQPSSRQEAEELIDIIEKRGLNYSVGLAQINRINFKRFNVSGKDLLDPCINLKVSQVILQECFSIYNDVNKTLSCYYSGNGKTGFKLENFGKKPSSYVARVHNNFRKISDKKIDLVDKEIKIRDIRIPSLKNYNYEDRTDLHAKSKTINSKPRLTKITRNNVKSRFKGSSSSSTRILSIKSSSKINEVKK